MSYHAQTAEARRASREAIDAAVTMRIETEAVQGLGDNLSRLGLMFFTDEDIRVEVEVPIGGEVKRFHGRLVRVQKMNETNTGLAIEFDEDE